MSCITSLHFLPDFSEIQCDIYIKYVYNFEFGLKAEQKMCFTKVRK